MSKSPITCHVLDSSIGKPAAGVKVVLQRQRSSGADVTSETWEPLVEGETNSDGRCMALFSATGKETGTKEHPQKLTAGGLYRIVFQTRAYFQTSGRESFYPCVEIPFIVANPEEHYHIPLLISPYSYTTYRGS